MNYAEYERAIAAETLKEFCDLLEGKAQICTCGSVALYRSHNRPYRWLRRSMGNDRIYYKHDLNECSIEYPR